MNEIIMYELVLNVKVRKYEVDIIKLQNILRTHKNHTNKWIANRMKIPVTMVEHWFRTDNCFSIPEPNLWNMLKEILEITEDVSDLDIQISEFDIKPNQYDKGNRLYDYRGISPTITCNCCNERILVDDIIG